MLSTLALPPLPLGLTPLDAVLLVPAGAMLLLAIVPGYRMGAAINVVACGLTFFASVGLLEADRVRSDFFLIDDFNIYPVSYTHLTLPTNREV